MTWIIQRNDKKRSFIKNKQKKRLKIVHTNYRFFFTEQTNFSEDNDKNYRVF